MSAAKFSNQLRPVLHSSALVLTAFLAAQPALAQVSTTGSVTSIANTPAGANQVVNTLSTVGFSAPGTVTVTGAGTVLTIVDGANPDASLRIGTDQGTGRVVVNNTGFLNVHSTAAGSDDGLLFISNSGSSAVTSQLGTLILGDDPTTGPVESTGFLAVRSDNDDAILSVGRTGPGILDVNNSPIEVKTFGPGASASALFEIGGSSTISTAASQGTATVTNSNVQVISTGAGAAVVSVGRGTDTVINNNPATAPENTLLVEGNSNLDVNATGTGTATFNVARDGTRGTATITGTSALTVDDLVQIDRDGGFGTMNVQDNAIVNNISAGGLNETRVGMDGGTGTLNITGNGVYNTDTVNIGIDANTASPPVSTGTVNISGNGVLNATDTIRVGSDATSSGTLNIGDNPATGGVENGGTANAHTVIVGRAQGSTGTVNVSGPGASINLSGSAPGPVPGDTDGAVLSVGSRGTAVLNVNNGGSIAIAPGTPTGPGGLTGGMLIGGSRANPIGTGNGTVNVDGAGSSWNAGNALFMGLDVQLNTGIIDGQGGSATVNIQNGGSMLANQLILG